MSILKSARPEYSLELPISRRKVNYTAFTMRTERTLMMATEGENIDEITAAVINCLNDHIRTSDVKAEDLPQAEAELLLLNMRAKSVGEKIQMTLTDPEDGQSYPTSIDLQKISIQTDPGFKELIELSNGVTLQLRLPGLTTLTNFDEKDNEFDQTMDILSRCVKSIVDGDECYMASDLNMNDIKEFLLDLESGDFKKITEQFFNKMPRLAHKVKVKKPDGKYLTVEVSGIASFL